jgi:hypothetical protein
MRMWIMPLHGIDVTDSTAAQLLHAPDEKQLAYATQKVLVTHDADYLVMHRQGIPHAGIAYCHPEALGVGTIIRGLFLLWGAMTPEEMQNRVQFL